MIGRFDTSRVIKKAIRVALLLGAGAAVSAVAFCEFGFVFNFTHSAPFGIYRQAAEPTLATRKNSPYAFFCPDQRWPGLRNNPNTRRSLGTCPDGYAALLKPVVAWPGDVVTTSPAGVIVDGTPVPNSSPLTRDSLGRELHPYPYGTYEVPARPDLGCQFLQLKEFRFPLFRSGAIANRQRVGSPVHYRTIQSALIALIELPHVSVQRKPTSFKIAIQR